MMQQESCSFIADIGMIRALSAEVYEYIYQPEHTIPLYLNGQSPVSTCWSDDPGRSGFRMGSLSLCSC